MHTSSLEHMHRLVQKYGINTLPDAKILDIGSYDVNGSYKQFFDNKSTIYTGLDMSPGPNVDVVLEDIYKFPFNADSYDLIISGQAFEHIEFFWLTWLEMLRCLKPNGMIFLIAPSRGPEHRYPQDCWRFYPDGYRALAKWGKCELLEVSTDWSPSLHEDSAAWGDTVGVFRK